jgi:hypothetical protein
MSENITVDRVGPYGIMVGQEWLGLEKSLTPQMFVKGVTYEIEVTKSAKGKRFIQKAIPVQLEVKPEAKGNAVVVKPSVAGRDFQGEAEGKTRCALLEALLSNPALVNIETQNLEQVIKLANDGFKYVFGR